MKITNFGTQGESRQGSFRYVRYEQRICEKPGSSFSKLLKS